jgi:hypothetical protein
MTDLPLKYYLPSDFDQIPGSKDMGPLGAHAAAAAA